MMNQESASAPSPSGFAAGRGAQTPSWRPACLGLRHAGSRRVLELPGAKSAVSAGLGDAGAQHAWACDVPGLDEFSNAPGRQSPSRRPSERDHDGLWMATVETASRLGAEDLGAHLRRGVPDRVDMAKCAVPEGGALDVDVLLAAVYHQTEIHRLAPALASHIPRPQLLRRHRPRR